MVPPTSLGSCYLETLEFVEVFAGRGVAVVVTVSSNNMGAVRFMM